MKKTIFLLLLIAYCLLPAKVTEHYFFFHSSDRTEIQAIGKMISIDSVKDGKVLAYATDYQLSNFERLGISYTVLPHPGSLYDAEMANNKADMRDWEFYPTYETYEAMMHQFATDYPELCQIINIGTTVQGRDLLVARISDNVGVEENEPEFFYTATMHGDETAGYVLTLRLIDYLLSNYGNDERVTNVVNNIDIFINPLANPDGTFASGNHTVTGATRNNANGVDLNRNFPDFVDGYHPDGNSWQPETIAMMDFAEARNFIMSSNIHGGAVVVNYPYDTTQIRHADDVWWQYVSQEYADNAQANSPPGYFEGFNNGITNGYDWYSINGGRQDYMNYYHHCREMTLEISQIKLLPENQLNNYWDYNKESFLLYLEQVMYGIHGVVQDENGNPLLAEITIPEHDYFNSHVFTDVETGNFHRLLAAGTWDLLISAEGYISQLVEDITVSNHSTTTINIVLQPQGTVDFSGVVYQMSNFTPIENAQVQLLNTNYQETYTNADGEFFFNGILEDIYTISIAKSGYSPYIAQVLIDSEHIFYEFHLQQVYSIDFENGQFPDGWQFDGNAAWIITSDTAFEGNYSAKSGNIGHNQTSEMMFTIDVIEDGFIRFYRKVSSELNYDFLQFYIDDNLMAEWSGEENWAEFSYPVSVGTRTFKWSYEKDGSVSNGSDCGWIDYIIMPPVAITEPVLSYSPTSFEVEMAPNSEQTEILYLTNDGQGILEFEIGHPLSDNWVVVEPSSGSIVSGQTVEILLSFNSSGLSEGTYNTELSIVDNLYNPEVPITMFITENDSTENNLAPYVTQLYGNYPNPFNPETTFSFSLQKGTSVTIEIFNVKGQKIQTLKEDFNDSGMHEIRWNGISEKNKQVSSGIYFYRFQTDEYQKTEKMLLLQ